MPQPAVIKPRPVIRLPRYQPLLPLFPSYAIKHDFVHLFEDLMLANIAAWRNEEYDEKMDMVVPRVVVLQNDAGLFLAKTEDGLDSPLDSVHPIADTAHSGSSVPAAARPNEDTVEVVRKKWNWGKEVEEEEEMRPSLKLGMLVSDPCR